MAIQVRNVSHAFHQKYIVKNLNFEIFHGDRLCIVGKSGAGKSVLFKLMTGLLQPTTGQVFIFGNNVFPLSTQISRQMGVVFQNPALIDSYNVYENIGIVDIYNNKNSQLILEKVLNILPLVGLKEEDINKKVEELSGGMKKRVSIARALYHEPNILFFDEPHSGLDPINAHLIDELISTIFQPQQILVMITHHVPSIRKIANKVLFIDQQNGYFFENLNDFYQANVPVIQEFLNYK